MTNKSNYISNSEAQEMLSLLTLNLSESKSLTISKEEELIAMAESFGWDSVKTTKYIQTIMNLSTAVRNVIDKVIGKEAAP